MNNWGGAGSEPPIPPIEAPCTPAGFPVAWTAGGVFSTGATDCAYSHVLVGCRQGYLTNAVLPRTFPLMGPLRQI